MKIQPGSACILFSIVDNPPNPNRRASREPLVTSAAVLTISHDLKRQKRLAHRQRAECSAPGVSECFGKQVVSNQAGVQYRAYSDDRLVQTGAGETIEISSRALRLRIPKNCLSRLPSWISRLPGRLRSAASRPCSGRLKRNPRGVRKVGSSSVSPATSSARPAPAAGSLWLPAAEASAGVGLPVRKSRDDSRLIRLDSLRHQVNTIDLG